MGYKKLFYNAREARQRSERVARRVSISEAQRAERVARRVSSREAARVWAAKRPISGREAARKTGRAKRASRSYRPCLNIGHWTHIFFLKKTH